MSIRKEAEKTVVIILGAFIIAIALNFFLIPANVFASGFTGVAQLIAVVLPLSTGIILFVLNIPVAILGWLKVGKSFTLYSFLNVALTTFFLEVVPIRHFSPDILLNAVFGGVLLAIGAGITLKWGASSGGLDIIALILSRVSDRPVGVYFFLLNSIIVITSGFLFDPEKALYTLVTLYVSSRVIDAIYTRHVKVTAMIVTKKADDVSKAIYDSMVRGITRIPAKGGYSSEDKEVLMIVLTRYELYELREVIQGVDPEAFTNVMQTSGIFGLFRKD
ncbi:YitT family protein [Halalkalibacter hemicellulosilyticus]|uniref:Membrane protein n=1 Tax=Halalkalibacter hemicellulosilyticusJCM 9152 TaxID=1236971 RepID=W4QGF5_9BACI|nr:YitT family protein [Halalkalibacter hemicellulosilyticus]GAE31195.1 membrane protein [Halalkalibacter hemicellulosilyticusJCM 9152]